MKRSFILIFLSILAVCFIAAEMPANKAVLSVKKYEIEKACIEYKYSGMLKGSEFLYFNKWGENEVKITDVVMEMGAHQTKNSYSRLHG